MKKTKIFFGQNAKNVHNPSLIPKFYFVRFYMISYKILFGTLKRKFDLAVYIIVATGNLTDGMRA